MSNLAYKSVESGEASVECAGTAKPKPFVVSNREWDGGDTVARRVAQVLDFELAQGSMPA
jgi:hypothetical protein